MMELKDVVLQTFEMMGFTFLVGMAVAYLILVLVKSFSAFRSLTIADFRKKFAKERLRRADIKKMVSLLEQKSNVEILKYLYDNKNKYSEEEIVDDLYNISNFYNGIYKGKNNEDFRTQDVLQYGKI
jgi:hypothetical protein